MSLVNKTVGQFVRYFLKVYLIPKLYLIFNVNNLLQRLDCKDNKKYMYYKIC